MTDAASRNHADPQASRPEAGRPRRRAMRLGLIALAIVGPLLAGELGLRALVRLDRLPVASAHSPQFEVTWTNLHRRDDWDVLLLGDSTMQQGINPAIIGQVMSTQLGREVHAFNGAVPGSKIKLNLAVARQLDVEGRLPPVVMLGIQPGWLGGNQEFENFFIRTPMGRIATDCAFEATYTEIVSCRVEQVSMLWRMRGQFKDIARAIERPMPTSLLGRGSRASMLGPDGYRTSSGSTLEALVKELDNRERRGQLSQFRLHAETIANFVELVHFLRGRGVTVVAVSIPNTPPLGQRLESLYPGWAATFDTALDGLEAAADLRIARPQIDTWFTPADAHNVKHLSQSGAATFTRQILDTEWLRTAMSDALRPASG